MDLVTMYLKKQALREGRNVKRQPELGARKYFIKVLKTYPRAGPHALEYVVFLKRDLQTRKRRVAE